MKNNFVQFTFRLTKFKEIRFFSVINGERHGKKTEKDRRQFNKYTLIFLKLTFYYTQHLEKSLLTDFQAVMKARKNDNKTGKKYNIDYANKT